MYYYTCTHRLTQSLTQQTLVATLGSPSSPAPKACSSGGRVTPVRSTEGTCSQIRPIVHAAESLTCTASSPIQPIRRSTICEGVRVWSVRVWGVRCEGCQLFQPDWQLFSKVQASASMYMHILQSYSKDFFGNKQSTQPGSNPDLPLTSQAPYHYTRMNNW